MTTFDLTGTDQEIEVIQSVASRFEGIESSEPSSLEAKKALNASVTAEEVKNALAFVTIVFNTGAAAIAFFKALRQALKERGGKVTVSESTTGKKIGSIEGATADDSLEKMSARDPDRPV